MAAVYLNARIADSDTGAGVGAAWFIHDLLAHSRLISVDLGEKLVSHIKKLFANYPNVEIRQRDCFEIPKDEFENIIDNLAMIVYFLGGLLSNVVD
ncbi:MAG: hypothetical protein JXA25_03920 [Anaerolineales bacterium]|nr:hypothetical protein [Anaerolineales bacterium]